MERENFLIVLSVLFLLIVVIVHGQDTCGVIGTNEEERTVRRDHNFYLNTQNPAPCNGNITSFQFCNYRGTQREDFYESTFAIYRLRASEPDSYDAIVPALRARRAIGTGLGPGGIFSSFGCTNLTLEDPVTVQAGDVIGACVFDPPDDDTLQNDVVGEIDDSNRYLMTSGTNGCGDAAVPSIVNSLEQRDSRVLHIHAEIVPNPVTDAPTQVTTPDVTTMGTVPTTTVTEIVTTPMEPSLNTSTVGVEPSTVTEIITSTTEPLVNTSTVGVEPSTVSMIEGTPTTVDLVATTALSSAELTSVTPSTSLQPTTVTVGVTSTLVEILTSSTVNIIPSSTETVSTTTALEEDTSSTNMPMITSSSDNILNQPRTSEAVASQPSSTTSTLTPSSSVINMITTQEQEVTSDQPTTNGPMDVRDEPNGTNIAIVPVVLIVLLIGAVVAVVMIIVVKKRRKHITRAFTIQTPSTNSKGFENAVYSCYGQNEGVQFYDEIQAKNVTDSKEHTYDYASASADQEHTYEHGFVSSVDVGAVYDNAYAEIGPFQEPHVRDYYSSPLDASSIRFSKLLEKNKQEDIYDHISPFQAPASAETEIYSQLKSWGTRSVPRNDIELIGHLGSGQFGSVEQGLWKRQGTKPIDVALKSLNEESSEEDKVKFLQEAAIMAQFKHANVILLHGVVIQGEPILLVVELATKGDLRKILLSLRPNSGERVPDNTPNLFLKFSQQVALGMQYLSAKGFVHRDLAARNVLVSGDNICKVADFGMSRDLADENYYISHGGMVPIKWTAPEAIHYKKYSTASDVWAYGCLLYEIWSVGHKPFEGVPNIDVIRQIDSGKRLSSPPGSPRMIYELMVLCWHPETSLRPAFRDIVLTLVGSEQMVLNIPEEDSSSNPLAGVLGAPLEAGENMYTGVQKRYIDYVHVAKKETEEDYFEID